MEQRRIPPVLSKRYNECVRDMYGQGDLNCVPTLTEYWREQCPHVHFDPEHDYDAEFYQGYSEYLSSSANFVPLPVYASSGIKLPKFIKLPRNPFSKDKEDDDDNIDDILPAPSPPPQEKSRRSLFSGLGTSKSSNVELEETYASEAMRLLKQYEDNHRTPPSNWTASQKELFKRFLKLVCERLKDPTFEHASQFKTKTAGSPLTQINYVDAQGVVSFARRQAKSFQRALKSRGVGLTDPYKNVRSDYEKLDEAIALFERVYVGKTEEQSREQLRSMSHEDLLVLLKFMEHLCYELHHGDAGKLDSGTLPIEKLLSEVSTQAGEAFVTAGAAMIMILPLDGDDDDDDDPDYYPRPQSSADRCFVYGWHALSQQDKDTLRELCDRDAARFVAKMNSARVRMTSDAGALHYTRIPTQEDCRAFAMEYLVQ